MKNKFKVTISFNRFLSFAIMFHAIIINYVCVKYWEKDLVIPFTQSSDKSKISKPCMLLFFNQYERT